MSFLLHFSVFTACAYFIKDVPRGIAGVEEGKEGGIVLVSSGRGKPEYFASDAGGGNRDQWRQRSLRASQRGLAVSRCRRAAGGLRPEASFCSRLWWKSVVPR
jgi:hypothetical protein